jgi:hypothetical protein
VLIFIASRWLEPDFFSVQRAHFFRPIYLVALGYLISYLGEHERRSKQKLGVMLDLTTAIRPGRPPGWALTHIMRRILHHYDAPQGVVVLRDPESRRYFTWDMNRQYGRLKLGLRISESDPYPLPFTSSTEAFFCNTSDPRGLTALCYDVVSGATQRKAVAGDVACPAAASTRRSDGTDPHPARAPRPRHGAAQAPAEVRARGHGVPAARRRPSRPRRSRPRASKPRPRRSRCSRSAPASRAICTTASSNRSPASTSAPRRACKMLDRDPARVPRELAELQQTVERGYREVRHYLNVLRSSSREAHDLRTTLEQVAAEFSIRERLRVTLELPPDDPDLPSTTAYELTQIVREALRNAVRHGSAKDATVKLTVYGPHCSLLIQDNGRGFKTPSGAVGADGVVQPNAVPWSIRERTAALGGTLRVRSQTGRGVEIHVVVPATHTSESESIRSRRTA